MLFEWDEKRIPKKHGIFFKEAQAVLRWDMRFCLMIRIIPKFLIIGMTDRKGVCIVSHCYHGEDEKIRIISARKATKTEQNVYNEQPFWR